MFLHPKIVLKRIKITRSWRKIDLVVSEYDLSSNFDRNITIVWWFMGCGGVFMRQISNKEIKQSKVSFNLGQKNWATMNKIIVDMIQWVGWQSMLIIKYPYNLTSTYIVTLNRYTMYT